MFRGASSSFKVPTNLTMILSRSACVSRTLKDDHEAVTPRKSNARGLAHSLSPEHTTKARAGT
jgi:hypothetical protein